MSRYSIIDSIGLNPYPVADLQWWSFQEYLLGPVSAASYAWDQAVEDTDLMIAHETMWRSQPDPGRQPLRFELGALRAEIQRHRYEWTVRYCYNSRGAPSLETLDRVVAATSDDVSVSFSPRMATSHVMARMDATMRLPVNARVTIYVTTPVWAQCAVDEDLMLFDLPVEPVSMAWFGPSTIHGQLCVSEETGGRLQLRGDAERLDRIITPVTVINDGADALTITRLNIPAPSLPVFLEEDSGLLWTPEVTIKREKELDTAKLTVADTAPHQVASASLAGLPRVESKRSRVELALDLLFA